MRAPIVVVIFVILLSSTTAAVSAHHQTNSWQSSTETSAYFCCYSRHENADSFYTKVEMVWNSTRAANLRSNQLKAMFFTLDQVDLNNNVDSYLILSNLPSPYNDWDDDNGDGKREEAEVVSQAYTGFPTAGTTYRAYSYWSHSYGSCNWSYCYDPHAGYVDFWENLSQTSCSVCDRYDTHCCTTAVDAPARYYPYNSKNSTALSKSRSDLERDRSAQKDPSAASERIIQAQPLARVPAGRPYDLLSTQAADGTVTDLNLIADLRDGIQAYVAAAKRIAERTTADGPASGVMTFSRPVEWSDLVALEGLGLVVASFEMTSAPDEDGLRWTLAADRSVSRDAVAEVSEAHGVTFLGITSAIVTVTTPEVLNAVQSHENVLLVDLAITDFTRKNPGVVDVGQDDIYWQAAGW